MSTQAELLERAVLLNKQLFDVQSVVQNQGQVSEDLAMEVRSIAKATMKQVGNVIYLFKRDI